MIEFGLVAMPPRTEQEQPVCSIPDKGTAPEGPSLLCQVWLRVHCGSCGAELGGGRLSLARSLQLLAHGGEGRVSSPLWAIVIPLANFPAKVHFEPKELTEVMKLDFNLFNVTMRRRPQAR